MMFCKSYKFRKAYFLKLWKKNIWKDEPNFPVTYSTKVLLSHIVMSKIRTGPWVRDFLWYTAENAGLFEQTLGFGRLWLLPVNMSVAEISVQLQQRPNFSLQLHMCVRLYPYLWDLVTCTQFCHALLRIENTTKVQFIHALNLSCMWYISGSCMYFEYLGNCKFKCLKICFIKHRIERKALL